MGIDVSPNDTVETLCDLIADEQMVKQNETQNAELVYHGKNSLLLFLEKKKGFMLKKCTF